jgi:hypothetical protein
MGYLTESRAFNPRENIEDSSNDNKPNLIKKQSCYNSDVVGSFIKDAITGAKYPWRVGSRDENRFFRVIYTSNVVDSTRKGLYDNYNGRSSTKAFYESPHAYLHHMRHKNIELDETIIQTWYEKMEQLYPEQYKREQIIA